MFASISSFNGLHERCEPGEADCCTCVIATCSLATYVMQKHETYAWNVFPPWVWTSVARVRLGRPEPLPDEAAC